MESCKAEVGKVSRKYFGNETLTTKAAGGYRINMTEAKSLIELTDGELVDEDEFKALGEILTYLVEVLKVIKTNL